MFEIKVDNEIHIRILHPDDTETLFMLLEKDRPRLRPWVHPSALPETMQATRIYAIECYLWSMDPMEAIDTPFFPEVRPYFPPWELTLEMGIWFCGGLAGVISLQHLEDRNAGEIGYWIAAEHEGKGIVRRCVCALMDHAIKHFGFERFIIGCATSNQRSRSIPERLGYELKEIVPNGEVNGEYIYDRCVYEISAASWQQRSRTQ